MKKHTKTGNFLLFFITVFCLPILIMGQNQTGDNNLLVPDSITPVIPVNKKSLLRDVDVIFNSRVAFDNQFTDGEHQMSGFNVNQFRLEIKGKIHDKVSFRLRERYTKSQAIGSADHISRAVDIALIKVQLSPLTNFTMGKLCADWGAYEFDYNPIDILQFNDFLEFADNFLVGAGLEQSLANKKHSFSVQLLNTRTETYEKQFGSTAPKDVVPTKFPLAAVGNWRGSFFDGKFETIYSYSFFNDAQGKNMNYIALGNRFKTNNFVLMYDFQYSNEDLDRTGVVTGIVNPDQIQQNADYLEHWVRTEYLVHPKVNLLLTAMTSNHTWNGNPDPDVSKKLSASYGLIPTVQYLPFKEINLRFYISYVARMYDYTSYAETAFGVKDYNTGLFSFGFVGPLLVL